MDIDAACEFAAKLAPSVTQELFGGDWISLRIGGKWFMLIELDAEEPRIALKLDPEHGSDLRDHWSGIRPAWHMNKRHWNDVFLNEVPDDLIRQLITESYTLVRKGLPKKVRDALDVQDATPVEPSISMNEEGEVVVKKTGRRPGGMPELD